MVTIKSSRLFKQHGLRLAPDTSKRFSGLAAKLGLSEPQLVTRLLDEREELDRLRKAHRDLAEAHAETVDRLNDLAGANADLSKELLGFLRAQRNGK